MRPDRKKKKAQKPQFLHQPQLAGCVVYCLLDHNQPPSFFSSFFPPFLQTSPIPTGQLV